MNRMSINSKLNSNGVLQLSLPMGLEAANREVQVTVELITPIAPMSREAWQTWVDSMAGSWHGDFERPVQGQYEERESLSRNTSWTRTPASDGFASASRKYIPNQDPRSTST